MTNLEKAAHAYRLPETTTPEELACRWSCTVNFGTRVLLAGYSYIPNGLCYFGAIYEHTSSDLSCEGEIKLIAVSVERFEDNGRALQWAMAQ